MSAAMGSDPTLADAARVALRCLDLTSLNDADGEAEVARLCRRARSPFGDVAALCVWPRLAASARAQLPPRIAVAAVANFPAGGSDIDAALRDVQQIVAAGAQEVDVVLPWRALQSGDDAAAARLLAAVRQACAGLCLKVILETGELREAAPIRRASGLALDAGADFLKTSTGKTASGATLAAAEVMLRTIAAHPAACERAGFKVSGGIRLVADVLPYIALCRRHLGDAALQPRRFRIGASSLLGDIEAVLGGTSGSAVAEGY
jgi:deoxyribose-phosphate aldolase